MLKRSTRTAPSASLVEEIGERDHERCGRHDGELATGRSARKLSNSEPCVPMVGRSVPMLDLNDFFLFVQVVDRGGFTAASRVMWIPSRRSVTASSSCEDSLGFRLLNRTSHKFGMTDAGEDFYRHAIVVLREAELAENAAGIG